MSLLLAHLSDAHIGPLPRPRKRELLGKRLTGYINWTRGRHLVHDMDVLNRLVADLKAQHPGHIAMTGDILNIGLKAEFPPARAWLETLGNPRDVSFVPGNHDAYVRSSLPYLATTFAAWTRDDSGAPGFPYLRVREGVAIIGLSSAVPTAPLIASGRVGRAQFAAAADLLDRAGRDGLIRVVLIHHPPHQNGAKFGRTLSDAALFEAMIRRHGAELVLHGHNHRLSVTHIPGPDHQVPVIGVASASANHGIHDHRAGYNLFRIEGSQKKPRISGRMRGLLPGGREIGDLRPIVL
ncbi:MAG: metallophosphoesterase family protein [Methylovirgula sp.]